MIEVHVNGTPVRVTVPAHARLLDLLRDHVGLVGTKEACGLGECGACTVLLDGRPALACITLIAQVGDANVETIEGVSTEVADLRANLAHCGGLQCGFCTPGQVVSAVALLRRCPAATAAEIRRAMSGNICRCTGYDGIVEAIERTLAERQAVLEAAPE